MTTIKLFCDDHHTFEAWFASVDSFHAQAHQGLISCPYCASTEIRPSTYRKKKGLKQPDSIPALEGMPLPHPMESAASSQVITLYQPLNAHDPRILDSATDAAFPRLVSPIDDAPLRGHFNDVSHGEQRQILQNIERVIRQSCKDVGDRFSEEVRKMHYGERLKENLMGNAHPSDIEQLLQEGIDVFPLPPFPHEDA